MTDKIKEEIKYGTEWLRFSVLGIISITSGIFSQISIGPIAVGKIIFVILGLLFNCILLIFVVILHDLLLRKLKKL